MSERDRTTIDDAYAEWLKDEFRNLGLNLIGEAADQDEAAAKFRLGMAVAKRARELALRELEKG